MTSPKESYGSLDAGKGSVLIRYPETNNYLAAEASDLVTISKAAVPFTIKGVEGLTYRYDSAKKKADEYYLTRIEGTVPAGVTVKYKTNYWDEATTAPPVGSDAGDYEIWYSIDGGTNYRSVNSVFNFIHDIDVTIAKAEFNDPAIEIAGWTYGKYSERKNTPKIVAGELPADYDGDVTWYYADVVEEDGEEYIDEDSWSEAVPEQAGRYAVKGFLADSDNYKDTVTNTEKFTVAKAPLDGLLSVSVEDWTYGEEPNEPVVEGNLEKGEVTFTYKKKINGTYSTVSAPDKPGRYKVTATVAATQDYSGGKAEGTFDILKGDIDPSVSISGWEYLKYNARTNGPELEGLPEGIGENDYWYESAPLVDGVTMDNLKDSDFHLIYLKDFAELEAGDYAIRAVVKDHQDRRSVRRQGCGRPEASLQYGNRKGR